jgi:hypothetical protein
MVSVARRISGKGKMGFPGSKLTDASLAVLAVWVALSLGGAAGALVTERATEWVASASFAAMLTAYSLCVPTGRRASLGSFMFGAIALLPLTVAVFFLVLETDQLDLSILLVGGNVGYNPGGMDSGAAVGGFVWWLTILLLVYVSLLPRRWLGEMHEHDTPEL